MLPTPDSRIPLPADTLIGPWRVLTHLKSGAFGSVYLAVHVDEPDWPPYALKLARHMGDARFEREAWLLSHLHHVGVPRLHATGTYRDQYSRPFPYLVMNYVEGEELYEWPRRHRLTTRAVLKLMAQVARALEATHQLGVHRDVKGDNVKVGADGHAVLLDFGACWYPGARRLTDAPVPPGTEPYRSPQILRFRYKYRRERGAHYEYLPEDDLYALGVTGYYLVTGSHPPAVTHPECADDPWQEPPPRRLPASARATILPEADAIIWRLMSEEPKARGSAKEAAEELEKAAASLGPEADERVEPTPFYQMTEEMTEPGPPMSRGEMTWAWIQKGLVPPLMGYATALALIGLFVLLPMLLAREGEESQEGGDDPMDMGSAALSSAAPLPEEAFRRAVRAVSLKVPNTPLKGQIRPPCDPTQEVEINKGCWIPGTSQAPCPRGWYEWKGFCYSPLMTTERAPTSEDP